MVQPEGERFLMALPTGKDQSGDPGDDQGYFTADEDEVVNVKSEEKEVVTESAPRTTFVSQTAPHFTIESMLLLQQQALVRLMPAPVIAKLGDKVLMQSHLRDVNASLQEAGLLVDDTFVAGAEARCRAAIRDSFSKFPEIDNQVGLWFSRGVQSNQIQMDLVTAFASSKDVVDSFHRALSKLSYGQQFALQCRDLFVLHQSWLNNKPHRMIEFVTAVCNRLPPHLRDRVVGDLAKGDEMDEWQLNVPFWEPSNTHTVLGRIETVMRADAAVRGLSKFSPMMVQSVPKRGSDNVFKTEEREKGPEVNNWLDEWAAKFPSVWFVSPQTGELDQDLVEKAAETKGPFRNRGPPYFFVAFSDDQLAKTVLSASLKRIEFRPFRHVQKNE